MKRRCQNCQGLPRFPCTGVPVARYHFQPSGNVVEMCAYALNLCLDFADDEPDLEPAKLEWIYGPGSWGICTRHEWPSVLCRDQHAAENARHIVRNANA